MRYFLYTYLHPENYKITREQRVFGTPGHGGDHLATKVARLRQGDIILIRDGSKNELYFFPYCVVTGKLHNQEEGSPWPDILWHDERTKRCLIYHLRCAVDFDNVPQLSTSRLTWSDLDSLNFLNDKGRPLQGMQAWGKKLSGNFIQEETEVARFNALLKYEPASDSS